MGMRVSPTLFSVPRTIFLLLVASSCFDMGDYAQSTACFNVVFV